jgi:Ni,Fe-hydrogenase I small subunit
MPELWEWTLSPGEKSQSKGHTKGTVELLSVKEGTLALELDGMDHLIPAHHGPVSKHMEVALERTYEATPDPKLVVAVGDCGCTGGIFGESYATHGRVANVIPVDVAVPGCPPSPTRILTGILTALESSAASAKRVRS